VELDSVNQLTLSEADKSNVKEDGNMKLMKADDTGLEAFTM
jgi:hypothetical protein